MECPMCNPSREFKDLLIKKYKFWHVELRSNQNYLGWCFIILNRHVEDLMDITSEEQNELFEITKYLRDALSKLFQPDAFNYASLGNVTRHVHLQVIPRYQTIRRVLDTTFQDDNWGKNYSPWDSTFTVPPEVLSQIKRLIIAELN